MNSEEDDSLIFEASRKMQANEILARIYLDSEPRMHLQAGFTDKALPKAVAKVKQGLNILLELCNLELNHHDFKSSDFDSELDSLVLLNKPAFAEGSYLGYAVCRDASWLLQLLRSTNRYDLVDFEDITAPLYEYFKLCIKANAGAGDMYMAIGKALFTVCTFDESYELEITRDILKEVRNGESVLRRWLITTLRELDEYLAKKSSKEDEVVVVRFWDQDYVVAYATSEFVKFDELDLKLERKNRYNDDFVHGQVYRNDKQFPDNPEDWLGIVLPEDEDSFIISKRTYSTMEEAQETEREFMNWLQALLDD